MTIERNDYRPTSTSDMISAERVLDRQQYYDHPRDVLDTALDSSEKRAILASWASDLFAIDSRPELRRPPGVREPIRCQDILDALKALDGCKAPAAGTPEVPHHHRSLRRPS
ncbi:hypothetical protein [Rhizobium grahamii]|uniref:Uncharacterized protein n=1 Tax=Rhizobium grahamii TaxID=1120045 RepID=A0A370KF75_9HYPH|nr:hypothetical protein [Rhizobium grahamii]RDJ02968.1 hypothetical protein B5K06_31225 [Rhizobium grahamii]